MICEQCKECWSYKVDIGGCRGHSKPCDHFLSYVDGEDLYLITGIEDGWISVDWAGWKRYLAAKKRLSDKK